MATITFKGGEEYMLKLSRLENATLTKVCGPAIHDGAEVVANAIRSELQNVPTDEGWGTQTNPTQGPKKEQKAALLDALGITTMRTDEHGMLNVKIGFDGYNGIKTKRWPNGQPNQMVARAIESGTTWMRKNRFVSKAVSKTKKQARAAMQRRAETEIKKIMK